MHGKFRESKRMEIFEKIFTIEKIDLCNKKWNKNRRIEKENSRIQLNKVGKYINNKNGPKRRWNSPKFTKQSHSKKA